MERPIRVKAVIDQKFQRRRGRGPSPSEPRASAVSPVASSVLGPINKFFEWFEFGHIFLAVVRAAVTPPFEFRELFRQLDEIGSMSLPLVALAGAATGVVLSMEARYSLTRFGAKSLLPAAIVFSVIHETGPIITGLVVSGRVGAGIGAELASMKVTEQIDAVETSAVSPYRLLAAPRILACILVLPLLTLAADASGLLMGWVAQALVSRSRSISSSLQGLRAPISTISCRPHLRPWCLVDHRADRVFPGYAHTGRRSRRRSGRHELGRLVFAVRDPGRCGAGEAHSHIFSVNDDEPAREICMRQSIKLR